MTTSRTPSWSEIGIVGTASTLASGLGSGISAAIRGGNIKESSSVVGLGSGLFMVGAGIGLRYGLFKPKPETPRARDAGISFIILQLIGTSIGYGGTKLFINTAVSKKPFVDAALGLPITVGLMLCSRLLIDYWRKNQAPTMKPHAP